MGNIKKHCLLQVQLLNEVGKNKKGANDGGEHQETPSATSSLTDCPSDNTAGQICVKSAK